MLADSSSKGIGAYIVDSRISSEAEVYVLDMGELSGFRVKDENSPEGDIAIEVWCVTVSLTQHHARKETFSHYVQATPLPIEFVSFNR